MTIIVFLSFLRLLMKQRFLRSLLSLISPKHPNYYLLVLVLSFLFSLGPIIHFRHNMIMLGPYIFLYILPGFDGMRVPARFVIMVGLAVSVFAAYGLAKILDRFQRPYEKTILTILLSMLVILESISIPLSVASVPVGRDIPEVYKWLGNIKGDFAILELPSSSSSEQALLQQIQYMYFSTYHWKKLVNGYSGYLPPVFNYLCNDLDKKGFPSDYSINYIKQINIKYLIVHSEYYGQKEWERFKVGIERYKYLFKPVKHFGEAYVYEVVWRN